MEDPIMGEKRMHSGESSQSIGSDNGDEIESPPHKVGYLTKYQDREVSGLTGSKWDKRFVVLENGDLSYYKDHTDKFPRYLLHLSNCAVRDDGSKPVVVRNFGFAKEEVPGKFYHIFSVYSRPHSIKAAEDDDASNIVPLLRFSTQSLAEKNQWIELISQACAYCDSEAYEEAKTGWRKPATTAPPPSGKGDSGTLPPLYFGELSRRPSFKDAKKYINKAATFQSVSKRISGYPPSRPMHRSAEPSPLSAEASEQNYRGLLNLAMLLLFVSHFRLLMETMRTHGHIFEKLPAFRQLIQSQAPLTEYPFISGLATIPLFIIQAFLAEYALSLKTINETTGLICHFFASSLSLLVPMAIVWNYIDQWILGNLLVMLAVVTWMKLVSYAHANSDYRNMGSHQKTTMALIRDVDPHEATLEYPDNITLWNLCYFWLAPTLTYQIVFPRTPSPIRWAKVAGIVLRLVVAICFQTFLLAQVIVPALETLTSHLEKTGGKFTMEMFFDYLLQLSIANTYSWLLMFYILFHLFLNLSAELTRFGDRVFYRDWWNASEVGSYWKLWNLPVHYWMLRHIYFPCIRRGVSKSGAAVIVFFVSAVLHEVLFSVPLHMIRYHSFIGMMAQLPLSAMTKYLYKRLPGTSIGNIIFWVSFCLVGQPMATLLYTIDYWQQRKYFSSIIEKCGGANGFQCGEL